MKLYSYWRSSCSWRVRIALHLKGLAYEYAAVHLVKDGGEQHGEAYRAINPLRTVPTLEGEGMFPVGLRSSTLTVAQFSALVELLYKFGAEHGVLWTDPEARAA